MAKNKFRLSDSVGSLALFAFGTVGFLSTFTAHTSSALASQSLKAEAPGADRGILSCSQYGAKGDGVTDDTAAIQAAVSAMVDRRTGFGRTLTCGPGTYLLSRTVALPNARQFVFEGVGAQTQFLWSGGLSSVPMFDIHGRDLTLENFRIIASTDHPLQEAIRLENMSANYVDPGHGTIRHVVIECVNGGCKIGIRMPIGAGRDANNDMWHLEDNVISNYSVCAVSIEGTQEHNIRFDNDEFFANGRGEYGICGKLDGSGGAAANFDWQGGFMGANRRADFYLGPPQVLPYLIRGLSSEGSCKLLQTDGPTGYGTPVLIEGVRWSDNAACATGDIISFNWPGPIRIVASTIGTDYKKPKTIAWQYLAGSIPVFEVDSTILRGPLSTLRAIFPKHLPTHVRGFSAQVSDSEASLLSSGS